ncbi:MAG: hypothetical protein IT236_10885, partial [Bacteroidia bacterium]|nr:hypothetical protein [Bacteroidia bacterium]
MKVLKIVVILLMTAMAGLSQNEQDAMRYSRLGVNGSSRFNAMGGAFGAVGADASCAAYNPAGLALFRKNEWSYSGNMRIKNNSVTTYDKTFGNSDAQFNFNNFGLVATFTSTTDKESRTVIALTATQLQNFNNTINIQGNTNNSSIAKDMLNLALQKKTRKNLDDYYEGMAYVTYLLDYDSANANFFSF